jgi:signal transduction histidine kinase
MIVGKETLLNVAKHTSDKKLIIDVIKNDNHYVMTFANEEGNKNKNITYGSGLTNIKRHVEELNGKMEVINEDNFIVKVEV